MRNRVEQRLSELADMASDFEYCRRIPRVEYFSDKLAAGYATSGKNLIELNEVLLNENPEEMLHETVAHEYAHIIVDHLYPRAKPHGREWQTVMREWFGVEPQRTHNLDTKNVKAKRQDRWEAKCGCQTHSITTVARNKMIFKGVSLFCRNCGSSLELTGGKAE